MTAECVFCRYRDEIFRAGDGIGDGVLLRRETSHMVIRPPEPVVAGHVLIVPMRHILDARARPYLAGQMFEVAAEWGSRQLGSFNLITSSGEDATQTVFHLHIHYVPRTAGDGLRLPWS